MFIIYIKEKRFMTLISQRKYQGKFGFYQKNGIYEAQ